MKSGNLKSAAMWLHVTDEWYAQLDQSTVRLQPIQQRARMHQLRRRQAKPANLPHAQAEGQVRIAGKRSK